jgi:hypothetical protein
MKDGISVDIDALKEAFTVAEVLEIIPRESWLEIFDVEEIVESIGLAKLQEYVDIPALLQDANDEKLAALLKSIPGLDGYVDAIGLIEGGYITESFVKGYVYKTKLEAALANLDPNTVMPTILGMTPAEINELVNVTGLLNADPPVLQLTGDNGVLDNAKAEAAIKAAGVTAAELEPFVDAAKAQAVLEAKYNTAEKIQELIDGGHGSTAIYNCLMLMAMNAGDYEEALKTAAKGLILTDGLAMQELKFNEAVCYEYLGDFSKPLELFRAYAAEYGTDEQVVHEIAFLETR